MTLSRINLSSAGPEISKIVLGCWRLAEWKISRVSLSKMLTACVDLGLTTFDHADIYGDYTCEQLFGCALMDNAFLREKIQLVTKCGIKLTSPNRPAHKIKYYDTSKKHIVASVENSLKMFHTDYLDLLLIHRPDPYMNIDEVSEAFFNLQQAGKVLHFGVSNFLPGQFELLSSVCDQPLVTNQVEFSVLNMTALNDGSIEICQKKQLSPMAWSPLGGGRLFSGNTEQVVRLRKVLGEVGDALGTADITQVALAWILSHPAKIVPIVGTGKMDRIERVIAAEYLNLSREQWFAIWCASTGQDVP